MSDVAAAILICASVVGLLLCLWGMVCNNATLRQRQMLLNEISRRAKADICSGRFDWERHYADFHKVSYNRHLICLMRLGNASKLYPAIGGVI